MTTVSDRPPAWIPDSSRFATRLALVRHHEGWNIKEAALACGLPPGTWRDWELRDMKPRDLLAVCRAIANVDQLQPGQASTPQEASTGETAPGGGFTCRVADATRYASN